MDIWLLVSQVVCPGSGDLVLSAQLARFYKNQRHASTVVVINQAPPGTYHQSRHPAENTGSIGLIPRRVSNCDDRILRGKSENRIHTTSTVRYSHWTAAEMLSARHCDQSGPRQLDPNHSLPEAYHKMAGHRFLTSDLLGPYPVNH